MSQCLSGSGCSKDQENYDWTTAGLNSEYLLKSLQLHTVCTGIQFKRVDDIQKKDTNKVYKLPLF